MKVIGINEKLELTLKEADQFKFISRRVTLDPKDFERIMTTSVMDESRVYGRAFDGDALLNQILSESNKSRKRRGSSYLHSRSGA